MVVHCMLAQRAGFSIDWATIDKTAYLTALTQELDDPRQGALDTFLKPYVRPAVADLSKHIAGASGLDGSAGAAGDAVYGRNDDPAVQAQYKQQQLKREEQQSSE